MKNAVLFVALSAGMLSLTMGSELAAGIASPHTQVRTRNASPASPRTPSAAPTSLDLSGVTAQELEVGDFTMLSSNARWLPAISPDERLLAYVVEGEKRSTVVVKDILSGVHVWDAVIERGPDALYVQAVAWSPDSAKVLAVGASWVRSSRTNGWMLEVRSKKVLDLGVLNGAGFFAQPSQSAIFWSEPEAAYVFPINAAARAQPNSCRRLSLVDLALTACKADYDGTRRTKLWNERLRMGSIHNDDGNQLAVWNADNSFTRVLTPLSRERSPGRESVRPEEWVVANSARFAVMVERFNERENRLWVYWVRRRQIPNLSAQAALLSFSQSSQPQDITRLKQSAEAGVVWADAFAPRINPLNQRAIGFEGRRKGIVVISKVASDGTFEAKYVSEEAGPPRVGDVLTRFRTRSGDRLDYSGVMLSVGK